MSFFSEIKSALKEIFKDLSQPVIWRGREMHCIIGEGQESVNLESGGFVNDGNFQVKFLESELDGECPAIGEIIDINSKRFRIVWVTSRKERGQIAVSVEPFNK